MDILVLGGTGAMGVPLIQLLSKNDNKIYVTTRSIKESYGNVKYIQGNAKDLGFLKYLLQKPYDVIIDFLVYSSDEFEKRLSIILDNTNQYFFFSSSRCYAESKERLTEKSLRLIDNCTDEQYLATDEYGLAKGKEENLLIESKKKNWTIIRPYITYNAYRIQLGVYEKENWLRRVLAGRTIVFPKDIAERQTTLTSGNDVANVVFKLIGNERALGEIFHITTDESHPWGELLDYYCKELSFITQNTIKVKYIENSNELQKVWNKWQIKYDRLYDRTFDNSKIYSVIGEYTFTPTYEGLHNSLTEFLRNPKWLGNNYLFEAWCDRQCREWTPLHEIPGQKEKLKYLKHRIIG